MFKKGEVVKIKGSNQSYKILEINKFGIKLNKVGRSWYSEDELEKFLKLTNNKLIILADYLQHFIGSTFYYYGIGEVTYKGQSGETLTFTDENDNQYYSDLEGRANGDQIVFPSNKIRYWDNWIKEHTSVKIWDDLVKRNIVDRYFIETISKNSIHSSYMPERCGASDFEKSLLAEIKIYQLIEKGYGGYPSVKQWRTGLIYQIIPDEGEGFKIIKNVFVPKGPLFFEKKDAEEFIKYNESLLRTYYGM